MLNVSKLINKNTAEHTPTHLHKNKSPDLVPVINTEMSLGVIGRLYVGGLLDQAMQSI